MIADFPGLTFATLSYAHHHGGGAERAVRVGQVTRSAGLVAFRAGPGHSAGGGSRMAVTPTCYRVADLAERWSCSHSKIRTLLRDGVLPTLQLGTMLRIPITAVVAYEARCLQQVESAPAFSSPGSSVPSASTPPTTAIIALRHERMMRKARRP